MEASRNDLDHINDALRYIDNPDDHDPEYAAWLERDRAKGLAREYEEWKERRKTRGEGDIRALGTQDERNVLAAAFAAYGYGAMWDEERVRLAFKAAAVPRDYMGHRIRGHRRIALSAIWARMIGREASELSDIHPQSRASYNLEALIRARGGKV